MKTKPKQIKAPEKLKQTIMLKKALAEEGINPENCKIEINHDLGYSYVNGIKLPVIFPKSHFEFAEQCHTSNKTFMFYFNGNAGKGNTRQKLMHKFLTKENSKITFNNDGRIIENKGIPNPEYFKEMAKSTFSLCPHQPNWNGDKEALWTYRYIEALILKTMPVQFKDTPLTKTFTENSMFRWDNDDFINLPTQKELDKNYKFAKNKFSLSSYLKSL